MENQSHGHSIFFQHRVAKPLVQHFFKSVGNPWGFESVPTPGGPVSLNDQVLASQYYVKTELIKTWLFTSSLA